MEDLILTRPQQKALSEMRFPLWYSPDVLIVIEGPSGVGKSTLVDYLEAKGELNGALILDPDVLTNTERAAERKELASSPGKRIVTMVPGEHINYHKLCREEGILNPLEAKESIINVKGMDLEETRNYAGWVASQSGAPQMGLEDVARYSLGVAGLVKQLIAARIEKRHAPQIAAQYLSSIAQNPFELGHLPEKYLQCDIPEDVMDSFHLRERSGIYWGLRNVLERRQELLDKELEEETPLFKCSDTVDIYSRAERAASRVMVYAPALTESQFKKVMTALAFSEHDGGFKPAGDESQRMRMFSGGFGKRKVMGIDSAGSYFDAAWDTSKRNDLISNAGRLNSIIETGQVAPLRKGERSVLAEAWAHSPGGNPITFGWMMESLLQQIGVPYMTEFTGEALRAAHAYDPTANRVIPLKASRY